MRKMLREKWKILKHWGPTPSLDEEEKRRIIHKHEEIDIMHKYQYKRFEDRLIQLENTSDNKKWESKYKY